MLPLLIILGLTALWGLGALTVLALCRTASAGDRDQPASGAVPRTAGLASARTEARRVAGAPAPRPRSHA